MDNRVKKSATAFDINIKDINMAILKMKPVKCQFGTQYKPWKSNSDGIGICMNQEVFHNITHLVCAQPKNRGKGKRKTLIIGKNDHIFNKITDMIQQLCLLGPHHISNIILHMIINAEF